MRQTAGSRKRSQPRRGWRWLLAAAVCLTGGCVATGPLEYIHNGFKVGPNYVPPPAPVAADWIEGSNPGDPDPEIAHWWTVFSDCTLNQLIAGAYDQNLTLRAAGMRIL